MANANDRSDDRCYPLRLRRAADHLERGEWACGHVIARGLMRCALAGGCSDSGACSAAARRMMGAIRALLAVRGADQ